MDNFDKTNDKAQEAILEIDPSRIVENSGAIELDDSELEEAAGGISFGSAPPLRAYCPKCRTLMNLQRCYPRERRAVYYCPTHGCITVMY